MKRRISVLLKKFQKITKLKSNVDQVVKKNLCSGCGVCAAACPTDAIEIVFNKNKEYNPVVSFEKCIDCGRCLEVCPFSDKNLIQKTKKPEENAINSIISIKRCFTNNEEMYLKSASGGALGTLLTYLLEIGEIDSVIHVESLYGNFKEKFFISSISTKSKDINKKRGSAYYPIEFSTVLKKIKEDKKFNKVAIVGVPCTISAIRKLCKIDKKYNKKIKYFFALVCSHNVNGQFAEYITYNILKNKNEDAKLIFRDKKGIKNDWDFLNTVITKSKKISENRHKYFTKSWRGYFFSLNPCLYCTDFLGNNADASFKDAWGFKNLIEKQGESVIIIRDDDLLSIIDNLSKKGLMENYPLSVEELIESQKKTFIYKTFYNKQHIERKLALKNNDITSLEEIFSNVDFVTKKMNQRLSNALFKRNKELVRLSISINSELLKLIEMIQSVLNTIRKERKKEIHLTKGKTDVLYTAGFVGSNVGDEAQLLANLELWKKFAPEKKITILSPNPDITKRYGDYEIIRASRNCFFGFKNVAYAGIGESEFFEIYFYIKYIYIKLNAILLKHLHITLCNKDAEKLLKKLKESNVLHIGGGGFLTGKTSSRLFDYMALIRLAKYFKTDIILSGQTIGVWKKRSHKKWAKNLRYAKFIGLRDKKQSRDDLREIGIDEEKIFDTFDDALFYKVNSVNTKKKYVVVNAHFWNTKYEKMKDSIIKIAKLCDYINEKGYKIYLVSMTPSDKEALFAIQVNMNTNATIFENITDPEKTVSIIKNASFCITMKHHPIIFAMAGGVPTIALYYDEYYKHKNIGAMILFDQEKYTLSIIDADIKSLMVMIDDIIKNQEDKSKIIKEKIKEYKNYEGFAIKSYLNGS
jgi:coenzyme F420 hydrogenase subunit beta